MKICISYLGAPFPREPWQLPIQATRNPIRAVIRAKLRVFATVDNSRWCLKLDFPIRSDPGVYTIRCKGRQKPALGSRDGDQHSTAPGAPSVSLMYAESPYRRFFHSGVYRLFLISMPHKYECNKAKR